MRVTAEGDIRALGEKEKRRRLNVAGKNQKSIETNNNEIDYEQESRLFI